MRTPRTPESSSSRNRPTAASYSSRSSGGHRGPRRPRGGPPPRRTGAPPDRRRSRARARNANDSSWLATAPRFPLRCQPRIVCAVLGLGLVDPAVTPQRVTELALGRELEPLVAERPGIGPGLRGTTARASSSRPPAGHAAADLGEVGDLLGLPERRAASVARSSQRLRSGQVEPGPRSSRRPTCDPAEAAPIPEIGGDVTRLIGCRTPVGVATGRRVRVDAEEPDVEGVRDGRRVTRLPGSGDRLLAQRERVSTPPPIEAISPAPARARATRPLSPGPPVADVGLGQGPDALHRLQHPVEPFGPHRARPPVAAHRDADLEAGLGTASRRPSRARCGGCRSRHPGAPSRSAARVPRARARRRAPAAGRRRGAGHGVPPSHRSPRADRPRTGGSSPASGSGWCRCGRRRRASDRRGDRGRRAWRTGRPPRPTAGAAPRPGRPRRSRPPRRRASSRRRRPPAGAGAGDRASSSRSQLQSMSACSVRCRGTAVRRPPVSRRNRSLKALGDLVG